MEGATNRTELFPLCHRAELIGFPPSLPLCSARFQTCDNVRGGRRWRLAANSIQDSRHELTKSRLGLPHSLPLIGWVSHPSLAWLAPFLPSPTFLSSETAAPSTMTINGTTTTIGNTGTNEPEATIHDYSQIAFPKGSGASKSRKDGSKIKGGLLLLLGF